MKYYPQETVSHNIKVAESIYKIFNEKLFNNEIRAYIKIDERRRCLECVNVHSNIIFSRDLEYGIEVPISLMNKNSDMIPVWILAQMILIHGLLHNVKLSSNRLIYKNEKFRDAAERYGLIVEKHDKYGYKSVGISDVNKAFINAFQFEHVPSFYEDGKKQKKSSTCKYTDSHGESVRATKSYHVLYCLTNQSKDTLEKVDSFMSNLGINRMTVEV